MRRSQDDKTGRDPEAKRGKGRRDTGALLCPPGGAGGCGLHRGFVFSEQEGGGAAAQDDRLCRSDVYGGERPAAQSGKDGADAGYGSGLSYGAHGDEGDGGKGESPIRRSGSRVLYQLDCRDQIMVGRLRDLCKCGPDREKSAKQEYPVHSRQEPCAFRGGKSA